MNPFYFGTSQTQLFGVHHPPEGTEVRDGAVLVCPPMGHEYIAAHRPLQQLAVRLSRAGLHVLRFDFYGCGDSAGDLEEATLTQWLDDVSTALQELRDTTGSRRLGIVGLRLGGAVGALAAAAAARAGATDIHACVLWEPVVSGRAYVEELHAAQRDWVRRTFPRPRPETLDWPVPEVLGFPLTTGLQSDLGRIDLLHLENCPAARVLLMQNDAEPRFDGVRAHFERLGARVEHQRVEHEPVWLGHRGGNIALVPVDVNQAIAKWVVSSYTGNG